MRSGEEIDPTTGPQLHGAHEQLPPANEAGSDPGLMLSIQLMFNSCSIYFHLVSLVFAEFELNLNLVSLNLRVNLLRCKVSSFSVKTTAEGSESIA